MEITDYQKIIYNTFLKVYAKVQNRGYKKRLDFDSIDDKTKNILQKLEQFFNEHKEIQVEDFFRAGYAVTHRQYLPLEFFITFKAIACYKKVAGRLNRTVV